MSPDEFLCVRKWMIDRWPSLQSLTNGQWIAYRTELERFDEQTVIDGLKSCFGQGSDFPPGVARLVKVCTELSVDVARLALPRPQGIPWAVYSKQRWGRVVPFSEIVEGRTT